MVKSSWEKLLPIEQTIQYIKTWDLSLTEIVNLVSKLPLQSLSKKNLRPNLSSFHALTLSKNLLERTLVIFFTLSYKTQFIPIKINHNKIGIFKIQNRVYLFPSHTVRIEIKNSKLWVGILWHCIKIASSITVLAFKVISYAHWGKRGPLKIFCFKNFLFNFFCWIVYSLFFKCNKRFRTKPPWGAEYCK